MHYGANIYFLVIFLCPNFGNYKYSRTITKTQLTDRQLLSKTRRKTVHIQTNIVVGLTTFLHGFAFEICPMEISSIASMDKIE